MKIANVAQQKKHLTCVRCFFFRAVPFGDPYENRTRDTAVKGRCLNLLTNGPNMVAANGLEPSTLRV